MSRVNYALPLADLANKKKGGGEEKNYSNKNRMKSISEPPELPI